MKRWLTCLLCVLLLLALLTSCGGPAAFRSLKREIKQNGYADEQTAYTLLKVSDQTVLYQRTRGQMLLYRTLESPENTYSGVIRLYFTKESVKMQTYEFQCGIHYSDGKDINITGLVKAKDFVSAESTLGCEFDAKSQFEIASHEFPNLFRYQLEEIARTSLYTMLSELEAYLSASDARHKLANYGFNLEKAN